MAVSSEMMSCYRTRATVREATKSGLLYGLATRWQAKWPALRLAGEAALLTNPPKRVDQCLFDTAAMSSFSTPTKRALAPQIERFVAEFIVDGNAAAAAARAGYSQATAKQQGSLLLKRSDVIEALREHRQRLVQQQAHSLERRFVAEYVCCRVASEAARRAGYAARSSRDRGYRLLKRPRVQALLAQAQLTWDAAYHEAIAEAARRAAQRLFGESEG